MGVCDNFLMSTLYMHATYRYKNLLGFPARMPQLFNDCLIKTERSDSESVLLLVCCVKIKKKTVQI